MNWRLLAGNLAALTYNSVVGKVPCSVLRKMYLRYWLGSVGRGTSIQDRCCFLNGRKVHLGERNVINFGCLLDGRIHSVRTGNDVSIGPNAVILTLGHDPQSSTFADRGGDVIIGDRAWIGYGALILPGVKIAEGAVVGAGSVVTKDVEPYTIVAGNPARKIKDRNRNLIYQLNYDTFF